MGSDEEGGKVLVDLRVDDARFYNHAPPTEEANIGTGKHCLRMCRGGAAAHQLRGINHASLYALRDIAAVSPSPVRYAAYVYTGYVVQGRLYICYCIIGK